MNGDSNNDKLPIKIVLPRKEDRRKNNNMGGRKKFCEVTPKLRKNLAGQFTKLQRYYDSKFKNHPNVPCIGKVKMKKDAIAKSYKPNRLLKDDTCPIIGSNTLDEIYVKVTPSGIDNIVNEIKYSNTKKLKANLTAIDKIKPYTEEDIFSEETKKEVEDNIKSNKPIKVKLFNFKNKEDNTLSNKEFYNIIKSYNSLDKIEEVGYSDFFKVYKIKECSEELFEEVIRYNSLKRISSFSKIHMSPISSNSLKKLDPSNFENPKSDEDYPIIGIIDSGIKKNHPLLEPWIYDSKNYVPDRYQNNTHGTFVAGMIQYGDVFNKFNKKANTKFKFLDIVAIPNDDPQYGDTDCLREDEFIAILKDVIPQYCDKVKIWNLSLGTDNICKNDEISDLAVLLDEYSDKYGVRFILSSGNYETRPLRNWPPQNNIGEKDRITSPAESVRSITVGSIAHKDSPNSLVNKYDPSPFSRRGPGANYIIKPEVVDFGGNIDTNGSYKNLGVISLGEDDNALIENIGTSFSTPLVTKTIGAIQDNINTNDVLTSKTLLIHSTRFSKLGRIDEEEFKKYYGFGHPNVSSEEILTCSNNKVTLIFDEIIEKGTHLELYDFPYPESLLRDGKWYGKIFMTLAYDPPLDPNFGQEYCRVNIDASLGTYEKIVENGEVSLNYSGEVPLEKNWDEKYEQKRVENGFKWSPIKSYYRNIPRGIKRNNWKLRVDFLNRNEDNTKEQRFILIITIIDPEGEDIYTDVVNQLRQNGFVFNDLKVRQKIRQQLNQ